VERRAITTSTWVGEYLSGWPGVAQVFRLVRERTEQGKATVEVVYGITSLGRVVADASDLLGRSREHWGIENGLHHPRDVTFGEDRGRVRRGNAPWVLASLRNVAVHLLRTTDHAYLPAATREMAARPELAIELIKTPTSTSA
jgi:predicted transposase YbfD/YdcC